MNEDIRQPLEKLTAARAKAVAWLLQHMGVDGKPENHEQYNGWCRLSWALSLGGETGPATAALEWAAREGIGTDGYFRTEVTPGSGSYSGLMGPYFLGQLACGALQMERYDVAGLLLDRLEAMQDAQGGIPMDQPGGPMVHISDMTSTAQAGLAALRGGRTAMAGRIRDWFLESLELQPELPNRLYVGRSGADLVTAPPAAIEWMLTVDYRKPRQAYFYSGIAAAFLGTYAMQTGDKAALSAGHRFLALNIGGTQEQFTDPDSVQICKFGWGVGVMQVADPTVSYREYVIRMSNWFVEHQDADGSWTPSRFQSPSPTIVERMMKTAEHAVEVTALIAGLAAMDSRAIS